MLDVITFGCRLNALESETMRLRAAEAGVTDAVLVNSCAVTAEAVRQARQAIRRAKREAPHRRIVVSGCAAETQRDIFGAMPEIALVLGNRDKLLASAYAPLATDAEEQRPAMADTPASVRTRAFLEVQNGCDHRCTFCIIPFGRGPSRSVPVNDVVGSARGIVAAGHAEIVLTGVDLTAYGADLPDRPSLGALVRALLGALPELKRLRLSSLDAVEIDGELWKAIAEEERLMPHFHLSLQSGDDVVLKRMKRRHRRDDAIGFATRLRRLRPDVVLGADVIVGFPTESEEAFQNSVRIVDDCGLTHLHVFPYSERPGTPASRMPKVDPGAIKDRAARLRERGDRAMTAHLAGERGRLRRLLVERGGVGRTEQFTPAWIAGAAPGTLVDVLVTGHDGARLIAAPVGEAA